MTRSLLALGFALALAGAAAAHPIPNLRFDRTVRVALGPTAVTAHYVLEVNDWTMVLDGKDLVDPAAGAAGQLGYARGYAAAKAPLIADALLTTLDGEPLAVRVTKVDVDPETDHVRIRFTLTADWHPAPGTAHELAVEDGAFEGRSGTIAVAFDPPGDGVTVTEAATAADLWAKPPLELKPGDEAKLRKASARFTVAAAPSTAPTVPPTPPPAPLPPPTEPPTGAAVLADRGLAGLFDTGYGFVTLLALAFGFGAAHAFTPGHGKTLVAAYLVGEKGTLKHAAVLGLTTTLAHTGSVILVAFVLRGYYGDDVPARTAAGLQVVGGMLIAVVGLWLFVQRAGGRADHVHLLAGHDHSPARRAKFGWVRVVLLGLGGGIVPCWDAVLLLLVAIAAGRLGAAVPLLVAFSAGLAAVLVGLGAAVVLAHRAGGGRFGESRWFRALPTVSAVVLVGLGVLFARDGVRVLFAG